MKRGAVMMKKDDMYVTPGLLGIREQIAEASRKNSGKPAGQEERGPETFAPRVSVFESLPEETRKALRARCLEFEHSKKDLLFRLHELSARTARMETDARRNAELSQRLKEGSAAALKKLERQQEPDEFSEDFQLRLSDNFRELDRIRLELIDLQAELPEENRSGAPARQAGLFAELDSVSFGQLFRIGTGLFLPVILTALLCAVLIAIALVLVFRV